MANIEYFAKNIDAVKENYQIWQSLNDKEVSIFFDTADVIDLLIGMRAMSQLPGEPFRWKTYHDAKQLVYAMAYKGWLGPIRLLSPHLSELYDQLSHERFQTINKNVDIHDIEEEFWGNEKILSKGVIKLVQSASAPSPKEKNEWLEQFIHNAPDIFQGAYLMDRRADWRERYAYLKRSKSLLFDPGSIDLSVVGNTPLFKALNEALNEKRKKIATANNYVDALALYMFDQKLLEAQKNQTPPPFFYAEQKHIYEAVQEVAKKKIDGRHPFIYVDNKNNLSYSVVRSAKFFFLYGILRITSTMFTSLWEPLEENIKRIAAEKNQQLKQYGKGEADKQLRLVFLEFFQSWWKAQGISDLKQPFSDLEIDAKEASLKQDVEAYMKEEFRDLRQRIQLTPEVLGIMRQTLISLSKMKNRIRDLYGEDPFSMQAEHEFGPRFAFGPVICDDIQERFNELQAAAVSDSETDVNDIKSSLVSSLSAVLTSSGPLHEEQRDSLLNRLASAMGILWLLNEFELIDRICRAITELSHLMKNGDRYPSAPFAIMHVAAILAMRKNINMDEVYEIIGCVEEKYGLNASEEKYKVWLALSYAHYRLAYRIDSKVYMPEEDLPEEEAQSHLRKKALSHLEQTLEYTKVAYKWLRKTVLDGTMLESVPRHNRYLRSSINNIIFCQTILLPATELRKELHDLVSDQEMFSEDSLLWHENRYSDTIARYYYRLARIAGGESILKKAKEYNHRSINSSGLSEKGVPNQLAKQIERHFPE